MNWTTPTRTSLTRMTRALTYLAGAMTLVLSGFLTAPAQQSDRLTPPKVEAKLVLGGASFADPSIPHGIVSFTSYQVVANDKGPCHSADVKTQNWGLPNRPVPVPNRPSA